MAALAKTAKMTVEEFLAWAEAQPGDGKYELIGGVPVLKNGTDEEPLTAMAPERFAHAEAKFAITVKLKDAIRRAGALCQAAIDGLGIAVDENTSYIPDAVVNCGEPTSQTMPSSRRTPSLWLKSFPPPAGRGIFRRNSRTISACPASSII